MHCLIFCAGTDGDCFPVFMLARHLRRRGHRVTVMAPPVYCGSPLLEDIGFQPLCTIGEYERFIADAGMLAGRYSLLFCRDHAVRWNLNAWRAIKSLNARDLLVLAPDQPFFWADVAAKLQLGCDAVRFQIEPPHPEPKQPGTSAVTSTQIPYGRIQDHLAAALALRWHEAAAQAGLTGNAASLASLSRTRLKVPVVALWPDWLVRDCGERRRSDVRSFGFLMPDSGCRHSLESDLPPIKGHAVFTTGRTDSWPARSRQTAIETCRKLGMRGLILGGTPPVGDLPPEITWRRFAPLDRALENARVIVHNGGIGTAATALRCGVPQIIVPLAFGQPGNAEWMRRLGVAAVIPPGRFTADALCRQIGRLTSRGGGARKRSLELSSRIDSCADSAKICEFLENLPVRELPDSEERQSFPASANSI
jgi:UDP:flavonoid glycosyltransferase YjiC (YdhE family)